MSNRCYAFASNLAMLLYVTCWMAGLCYQVSKIDSYGIQEFKDFNQPYYNFLAFSISGACLLQLGLLSGLLTAMCENKCFSYLQYIPQLLGYVLITIGMGCGGKAFDGQSFNIPVEAWFAMTGVYLQCNLNAYEHSAEDEIIKEVVQPPQQTKIEL